jgi:hypothetical protein
VQPDRTQDIERGLDLIPRLGEVMPEDAGDEIRELYEDVRARLRVPFVNFIFRVLANYPAYLSFAWDRLAPHLLTSEFERAADDLRLRSLPEPVPGAESVDREALGDIGSIRDFTDTIHYVLPKLLLVVSAFDEGLGGSSGGAGSAENSIEPGVAEGAVSMPMVSPEEARGDLRRVFEEIRDSHGHPGVASYYRGIAQWPGFLAAAWERVGPLVGSPTYEERKRDLLERARDAVLALPLPEREEAVRAGVEEAALEELRSILAVFHYRVIPDTFVEVAAIKAMLDGPESARSSRFSFMAS